MKSLGNFPDPFAAEIAGQPDAIRRAARSLADQADELREAAGRTGGTLFMAGMGSSYDACYPAVTSLATVGIPALMLDAAELLHFRLPMLRSGDTLVLVSQSGESAEVVRVAERLRAQRDRPLVVAVTNGPSNTLALSADVRLDTRIGPETGPSTMTFAGSIVVLASFAKARARGTTAGVAEAMAADADAAAIAVELLVDDDELPGTLLGWHGGRTTTVILGRGAARAAAEMGALTLKEVLGMPVESLQTGQFRHGPLEVAGRDLAAIVLATEKATRDLDLALAQELRDLGSAVLAVTAGDPWRPVPSGALTLDIGSVDRLLAPAVSVVPSQLLAWRLAEGLERVPGSYVHATKVTTRE